MSTMQPAGVYAARTDVPVSRSIEEVKECLKRYGVQEVAVLESPSAKCIAWRLGGTPYRINVATPEPGQKQAQQERQRWRAVVLVVKAILETAPQAGMDAHALLLPYMVLPNGQTVAESAPQIQASGWAALMPKEGE